LFKVEESFHLFALWKILTLEKFLVAWENVFCPMIRADYEV
jgi:hypothetical protein